MIKDGVRYLHCTTTGEFLSHLHPNNAQWEGRRWVFRGHNDFRWELLPKAFRKDAWDEFGGFDPARSTEQERSRREAILIHRFGVELDQLAIHLPEKSHDALEYLAAPIQHSGFARQWIRECAPIAALAQHHGLPTRLLDFTDYGHIAAYFAAQKSKTDTDAKICVWALDVEFATSASVSGFWIAECRVPRASNPNLHAQWGLFLMWTGPDTVHSLKEILQMTLTVDSERVFLVCITLPRDCIPRLFHQLADERITGAQMFPSADGVVRHLKERAILDSEATYGPRFGDTW